MRSVKIGGGQGFYGDAPEPAVEMAARTEGLGYIGFDCLSELTLAILERQRRRDPRKGFALDILRLMPLLLPIARARGIRLVTSAGGMNPHGAQQAVVEIARKLGLAGLRVAVITGDDLSGRLDDLFARGHQLTHMDTGVPLATDPARARIVNANAYLGAEPIRRALAEGADVVITGRVTDSALFLGPLMHEFGWSADDWDRLAQGIVCGHLLECAGQVVGGNHATGWRDVPALEDIGYPVAEVFEDGSFVLGKTPNTGGRVSFDTVREQLLYEVHDPAHYLTPDVDADFSAVRLEEVAPDSVQVTGARGRPSPANLKLSIGYEDGWLGEGQMIYSWPNAIEKAQRAAEILRHRLARGPNPIHDLRIDLIGVDALHGPLAPRIDDPNEVVLRVAARTADAATAERIFRELVPLALNGPPTACGAGAGRNRPRELYTLWPALIARTEVEPQVTVDIVTA
jgi:hypothetical protein